MSYYRVNLTEYDNTAYVMYQAPRLSASLNTDKLVPGIVVMLSGRVIYRYFADEFVHTCQQIRMFAVHLPQFHRIPRSGLSSPVVSTLLTPRSIFIPDHCQTP